MNTRTLLLSALLGLLVPAPPGGAPAGGVVTGGGASGSDPAPRISRVSLRPSRFRATGRRSGTRIRFTLSEPARVTITVERRVGRLRLSGRRGANVKPFSGRLAGRLLPPGRYRVRLVAVDASNQRSEPRVARFTVLRA